MRYFFRFELGLHWMATPLITVLQHCLWHCAGDNFCLLYKLLTLYWQACGTMAHQLHYASRRTLIVRSSVYSTFLPNFPPSSPIGGKRTLFKPSRTIGQFINYEKTNRMCAENIKVQLINNKCHRQRKKDTSQRKW